MHKKGCVTVFSVAAFFALVKTLGTLHPMTRRSRKKNNHTESAKTHGRRNRNRSRIHARSRKRRTQRMVTSIEQTLNKPCSNPSNEVCRACQTTHEYEKRKSDREIERRHYLDEMLPLFKKGSSSIVRGCWFIVIKKRPASSSTGC